MLIVPTVNRNGSSEDSLLSEYERAVRALCRAWEAINNMTVNGRDFPGGDSLGMAINQRDNRLKLLGEMRDRLREEWETVLDQLDPEG